MTATVIPFPDVANSPSAVDAMSQILDMHADSARALADDVRDLQGPYDREHMQLARDLRRAARKVTAALDRGDLDVPTAFELLELTDPLIKRAHRLVITEDVRLACEPEVFAQLGEATVTVGEMSLVAFESFVCGAVGIDLTQFIADESRAPVPMMHIMQRVIAHGFVAGLDGARPEWFAEELREQVRVSLGGVSDMEQRPVQMASPFGVAGVAALQVAADRWFSELGQSAREAQLATYDHESSWVIDRLADSPRELRVAPSVADLWDMGFIAGMAQVLLDELADAMGVARVRDSNAVAWLELLDPATPLDAAATRR